MRTGAAGTKKPSGFVFSVQSPSLMSSNSFFSNVILPPLDDGGVKRSGIGGGAILFSFDLTGGVRTSSRRVLSGL